MAIRQAAIDYGRLALQQRRQLGNVGRDPAGLVGVSNLTPIGGRASATKGKATAKISSTSGRHHHGGQGPRSSSPLGLPWRVWGKEVARAIAGKRRLRAAGRAERLAIWRKRRYRCRGDFVISRQYSGR